MAVATLGVGRLLQDRKLDPCSLTGKSYREASVGLAGSFCSEICDCRESV